MLNFGLLMGVILFVAGVATYFFAPRVGPNPFFGVRVGYSYASREVWDKSNRLGGAILAAIGLLLLALTWLLSVFGIAETQGLAILTGVMLVTLLGSVVVMFVYARRLAQGTSIARTVTPVRFRWAYLVPTLVTFTMLVALMVYVYPMLPPARMATHFNIHDEPDGWMSRAGFVQSFIGMSVLFLGLNIAIVWIATREPLIAFSRWGTRWQIAPERGLIYTGVALAMTNVILMIVLLDVAWFNIRGAHLFPLSLFVWLLIPFIAILIALFFVLARRKKTRDSD